MFRRKRRRPSIVPVTPPPPAPSRKRRVISGHTVKQLRKDDARVGKAAAAGGGRGSGGANRAWSDQRDSSRVKDLDNLSRRKQAEILAVGAMAKREEEAQREAARKREEALRREWENDRLRKDKIELDRKMIEREERRRKAASVRNCARAADGNRVHRQGGSKPQMEAACGAITKPSEMPLAAAESREAGAAAAVSPSPPPSPVVRTRARWVKRPYVAASPGPPSLRDAIQQLRGEMSELEAGVKRTETNEARGSSNIGARSPIPPSSPAKSPAHASSTDKEEALSRRLVSPTSPHSSSEDSEDLDALQWGGEGKGEGTVNTRSSAARKKGGVSSGYQRRGRPGGRGEGGGTDEADEDLHAREEILENELRAATNRCKELRCTLQETKSMIPASALVVVDGSEPLDREITGARNVSPSRSSLPRSSLSVVEDDESEGVDDGEEDCSTRSGLSQESRNSSNIRGRNSSRNSARNGLRNGESGSGLQGGKGGNMGVGEGGEQATQSSEGSYSPAETGRRFYYQGGRSRTKSEANAPDGIGIGDINAWQARYPRLPPSVLTGLTSSPVSSVPTPSDAACKETRKSVTRENKPTSRWMGGGVVVAERSGRSSDVITRTPREDSNSISPRVDRRGRSQDGRSSELGSPRVYLSPPSPPPSVPTGKLADRIRVLRERCQLGLGTDAFDRAYRYLKDQEEPDTPNGEGAMFFASDDREERLLQGFTDIIGQDKARYYWLIDQLIFIEDAYTGSGF